MKCPRNCQGELRAICLPEGGEVHLCDHCEGAWYPTGSLTTVGHSGRESVQGTGLAVSLVGDKLERVNLEEVAHCPVCEMAMNRFTFSLAPRVKIDECLEHGAWLDDGELGDILDSISEVHLDIAQYRKGKPREAVDQNAPFAFTLRVLNALLSKV